MPVGEGQLEGSLRLPHEPHEGAAALVGPHGSGTPAANEYAQREPVAGEDGEAVRVDDDRDRVHAGELGGGCVAADRAPYASASWAPRRICLSLINRAKA